MISFFPAQIFGDGCLLNTLVTKLDLAWLTSAVLQDRSRMASFAIKIIDYIRGIYWVC